MNNGTLYAVTVLVWGSTWLAIEYQLGVVAPEVSVFYRFAAAAALLFGLCLWRGYRLRFAGRDHMAFLLLGACLFGLNYLFMYAAQTYVSSALSAIAFSTMLWMNIVNSRIFFGTRLERRVVAGSVFGIAGIIVLFTPALGTATGNETLYGVLLCLAGALVASFGNMVSHAAQQRRLPVIQSNAWGMLYGAVMTGSYAAVRGQDFAVDPSSAYLLSMAYLVVFGSIIGFGSYLTLLGRIGAQKAAYAVVMFPVVAVVLSVLVEGTSVTATLLAGITLVISGNLLTLCRGRPPRTAETAGARQQRVKAVRAAA